MMFINKSKNQIAKFLIVFPLPLKTSALLSYKSKMSSRPKTK